MDRGDSSDDVMKELQMKVKGIKEVVANGGYEEWVYQLIKITSQSMLLKIGLKSHFFSMAELEFFTKHPWKPLNLSFSIQISHLNR